MDAGIALFYLHARFSYVIALALAMAFALGTVCAAALERAGTTRA